MMRGKLCSKMTRIFMIAMAVVVDQKEYVVIISVSKYSSNPFAPNRSRPCVVEGDCIFFPLSPLAKTWPRVKAIAA